MKNLLFIIAAMGLLVMVACEKEGSAVESTEVQKEIDSRTPPQFADICHKKPDGTFVAMTVPINALPQHISHGDIYADHDYDGYSFIGACSGTGNDCDDNNPNIHPGATEICNGKDDDCDTFLDVLDPDILDYGVYYRDVDEDGSGDPDDFTQWCTQPEGYVESNDDCNDGNPAIHPGAIEIPNDSIDQNCDGSDLIVIVYPPCDCFTMQDLQDLYIDQPWPFGWYSDVPGSCKDAPYDQLMEVWLTNIGQPSKNYNFSAQAGTINGNPFASKAKFNHLTNQFETLCGGYTNAQNASNCALILHDFIAQMRSTHPTWDYCIRFP